MRVGDVVLTQLAGSPTGHVQKFVVEREVDIRHQRRNGTEAFQKRRQHVRVRLFRRDRCGFLDPEFFAVTPPGPDRTFEIGRVDDNAEEAVFAGGIVCGTHFEGHLVIGAEIDRLNVAARSQVPEVNAVAVLVREQVFGNDAVLELRRKTPLAAHHIISRQVPPKVIVQGLRAAVDLPAAEDFECLAIDDEDARGAIGAVGPGAAERAHINAIRAAVDRVRPGIARLVKHFFGLNDFVDFCFGRMRLRIDDVETRRPESGDDQIAPLDKCVPSQRGQRGRARVPAEMVELVALVRHRDGVDDLSVVVGGWIDVDDGERIRIRKIPAQQQGIRKFFGRSFDRKLRRGVERRIGSLDHGLCSSVAGRRPNHFDMREAIHK